MNAPERLTMSGVRAAIIDLDGTMLDTAPDFQVAINRMRDELSLAPLAIETPQNQVVVDSPSDCGSLIR